MAVKTTTADGNYNAGATWVGGVAPISTDTVVLAHNVTVTANASVGASTPATDAITINSGGTLTIAAGVTLSVNGDITGQASNRRQITINAGGGIEFGNGGYLMKTPSQYSGGNPWLYIRGADGTPAFIRTASGGTNARFTGSVNYYGLIDAGWCDFTRLGSSGTTYAMAISAGSDGSDSNASLVRLIDCNFDACGDINFATDIGPYAKVTLQRVKFTNSLATYNVYTRSYSNKTGAGVRLIDACVFDKTPFFNAPRDFVYTNNAFLAKYGTSNPENSGWDQFEHNLVVLDGTGTDPAIAGQTADNNYWYYNNPSKSNAHFHEVGNYTQVGTYALEGNVYEGNFSNSDGDCIIASANPTSPITASFKRQLVLPNASGETSGTLISMLGNANWTATIENNTAHVGTGGGMAVGETYAGHTGMLASFRGNLFWDTSARNPLLYDSGSNDTVSDLVSSANANYNARFNVDTYENLEFSSGSPGANDITTDPEFVDATRDFLAFDVSLGGDGVIANALARFAAQADGYTPQALVEWVKEGFSPTNPDYEGASFDGGDIGAMPFVEAASAEEAMFLLLGV